MQASHFRGCCAAFIMVVGFCYASTSDSPLKVVISRVTGVQYSSREMPINITLVNVSDQPLRVLDVFQQEKQLIPAFFLFQIKSVSGTYVPMSAGGKIDVARNNEHYIELKKNQKYRLTVNLADYIKSGQKLAGQYTVSVTFANQYGRNCFIGKVPGNSIDIYVYGS